MRILCITHSLPYPATSGGSQRTALLLRALSQYGTTDLIQICRFNPPSPEILEYCHKRFNLVAVVEPVPRGKFRPWNLVRPLQPKIVDRLAQALGDQTITYRPDPNVTQAVLGAMNAREYNLIVGRYLYPAAMADLLNERIDVPVIVDLDDVDHIVARENTDRSTPWVKRMVYSMHRPQIEGATLPLLKRASHLWVSAADDARGLAPGKCSVLPNIPYGESDQPIDPCPPFNDSKRILMVGMLSYRPNVEGTDNFLRQCWPQILRAVPDATLRIIGGGLSIATSKRWARLPGVEVGGFVTDLRAEYQRCAFSIVPVQRGGGTKIKAIECFAFGRTCVVTPHSHRGIESILRHGESLWRASDDADFTEGCIQLLINPDFRNILAAFGRQLVNENFSFKRFRSVIEDTLNDLGLLEDDSRTQLSFRA